MRRIQLLTFCITIALAAGAQTVTIEQLRPGELGRQVLRQVENLKDVVQLTIQGGTMNYQDMELLQETMPNLEALDLGGIDNTTLTAVDQNDGSNYRRSFTLGEKPRLKRLVLPSRLTILEKLGQVPSIEELDVPPSVVRIQQGVIQNGYLDGKYLGPQLKRLTLHEGLQVIDPGAFDGCDSLRQVTLPSTVIKATRAFTGCDNLKEVTSLAPVPPLLANVNRRQQWNWEKQVNEVIVTYEDYEGLFGYSRSYNLSDYMKDYVLTCPSTGGYELERGWDHFPYVKDLEGDPAKDYRVAYHYGIIGNDVPTNKPNLTLACGYIEDKNNNYNNIAFAGKMTTRSEQTLSIGTYTHETNQDETVLDDRNSSSWQGLTNMDDAWASLYCNGPMRADTVKIAMRFTRFDTSRTYWAFAALPFDTKVGDLKITEGSGVQWAIRKYSGLKRANAQFDEVWVKQTADSVLHAGEGFIVAVEWNHDQSDGATLVFTAQNNANKNRLFTSQDVEIPLQQYAAQSDCDRSWNLVGNPYPCFYSTKYFQPSAPFTVYDKARRYYRTYSPIDDDYVPTMELFVASMHEVLRHADNPNRLEAAQNLIRAFFLSMPQLKKAPTIARSHREELMFRFLDVLRNNFRNERTIDFYANSLCLSSKHLSKVVKQVSGRTVHDWIDEYVTTEATALLRSTDMTISQVSDALGFASQPLFTKFFRRTTGHKPSDVRKKE